MRHDGKTVERAIVAALLLVAGAGLFVGWKATWFLTDDAFITFRYVSNSVLGHGYVWNPAPFRPVEGYSSFLWMVLLEGLWRLLGTPPPVAANVVAFICACLSLAVGAGLVLRLSWRPALRPWRTVFLGLFLLGAVSNRTFVTWASSGFETALFNLLVLCWIGRCLGSRAHGGWHALQLSTLALLLHLTRPEGVLFAAATVVIVVTWAWERGGKKTPRFTVACTPILGILVHLAWRHSFYGAWLPNTYHAKVVAAWPESGVRYALSFVLEYALWFPLVAILWVGLREAHERRPAASAPPDGTGVERSRRARASQRATLGCCLGALTVQVSYYTFILGGDHFEYRVYSHLVVPGLVGLVWLANRTRLGGATLAGLLALQVLLALPVPWTHWALSQELHTRAETKRMLVRVAPHWPRPLRWYAGAFDDLQAWLIEQWVCVRHQEHKVNRAYLESLYPPRADGERLPADGFPVHACQAVGVASWRLPRVNILDLLGLNDYIIARTPVDPSRGRLMAHQRRAPENYVECFAPNVFPVSGGGVRIAPRSQPLTAEQIVACERSWAARLQGALETRPAPP